MKPRKPVNNKSNPLQGPVNCSPPPILILNPKSSECLPSTPNGSSSRSFTPQKACSSNFLVSLVEDRINEDPIHEQDSIFGTPLAKISTSEERISRSSKETDDEITANRNPLSLLEDPSSDMFEFSQNEGLALESLSQLEIFSPVRSTNSLVPSLKANKHSIQRDTTTQNSFPAKSLLNHNMSKSKSRLPVPLRVEKTKVLPSKIRRTKQKPTRQSENAEGINGGLPLVKYISKNKPFSAVAAAKKRKFPENGENNNQSLTTGCAILSHCISEKETETVEIAPIKENQLHNGASGKKKKKDTMLPQCTPEKEAETVLIAPSSKNQLPKDSSGKEKRKDTSCVMISRLFTPEKETETVQIAPLKKNNLPKDASGKKKRKDTACSILPHCTPEKVIKTGLNAPFKEHQLPKDDSFFPSSTVSTSTECVGQKKWIVVDESPVKEQQSKPRKRFILK